jgi:hypothetical protein
MLLPRRCFAAAGGRLFDIVQNESLAERAYRARFPPLRFIVSLTSRAPRYLEQAGARSGAGFFQLHPIHILQNIQYLEQRIWRTRKDDNRADSSLRAHLTSAP